MNHRAHGCRASEMNEALQPAWIKRSRLSGGYLARLPRRFLATFAARCQYEESVCSQFLRIFQSFIGDLPG
jgi:hypothetical protein